MAWPVLRPWPLRLGVLGLLLLLGMILWHTVPPQPRCRIPAGDFAFLQLFQDGRKVILANKAREFQLWDTVAGELLETFSVKEYKDFGTRFYWAMSPDDRYLVRLDEDQYRIFDLLENRQIPVAKSLGEDYLLSACGRNSCCLGNEKTTLVVELATGHILKEYPVGTKDPQEACSFSPNDEFFLLKTPLQGKIMVDHLPTGRPVLQVKWEEGDYHFSPGNRYLVFCNDIRLQRPWDLQTVRAWDLQTGRETLNLGGDFIYGNFNEENPYFAPDDRFLIIERKESAGMDVWETSSGKKTFGLDFSPWHIGLFAFSPDGNYLVVLVSEPVEEGSFKDPKLILKLFSVPSAQELWQQPVHYWAHPDQIGFSQDSRNLLILFGERFGGSVVVFEVGTGKKQAEWGSPYSWEGLIGQKWWVIRAFNDPEAFWPRAMSWLGLPAEEDWLVIDPWTGQIKGKLPFGLVEISRDNRTLIAHSKEDYLIFDLPLRPPLRWVVGPPLALGLLLVALARWRRWRRHATHQPEA